MKYVLDSNVAAKWVIPEPDSARATDLRIAFVGKVHELMAPDVLPVEVGHALTRAERQGRISQSESLALKAKHSLAGKRMFRELFTAFERLSEWGHHFTGDSPMIILRRCCALGLGFVVLMGCGKEAMHYQSELSYSADKSRDVPAVQTSSSKAPAQTGVDQAPAREDAAGVVRKIVYKADVELECNDLTPVAERLEALAVSAGGFVADAQLVGASGEPRWGTWKLRVPTGRFENLLAEIKKLAEVRSTRTSSDDVSEEFYDVEARIRNKQQEETRLLKLLDDRTAKLEEVLSVEREISRVRGEVEQLQARMRVLMDLTDLATVTVRVHEVHGYVPETAPGFGTRLARSVQQSFDSLVGAGEALIIALAVVLPWMVAMAVPAIGAIVAACRFRTRARGA